MSTPKRFNFVTVDVFTEERYKGNPLAIVHVPKALDLNQDAKQAIAREFNLSETVFLHGADGESSDRKIDIFITTIEIPFAGHPTIGSICHIGESIEPPLESVKRFTLHTKAGPIAASYDHKTKLAVASIPHDLRIHQSSVHWKYILNAQPPLTHGQNNQGSLLEGWNRRQDGSESTFPIVSIVNGMTFILVDFPNTKDYLEKIETGNAQIDPSVTVLDEGWSSAVLEPYYYVILPDEGDHITRLRTRLLMFNFGEDPATGSAASALASYLSLQKGEAGKTYTYKIEQGVEMGRRSQIGVEVGLDASGKSVKEVLLSGTAAPLMQGTLVA